jgi:hypothetical protein
MAAKQFNVRLEESLIKEVRVLCAQQDRKFQELISELLTEWVEKNRGETGA